METQTPPDSGHEGALSGKTGATLGVVLATTLWVVLSVFLIPVLGIGIFMLPMTAELAAKTRLTLRSEPVRPFA